MIAVVGGPALESDVFVGAAGWTQAGYAVFDVVMLAVLARALLGRPSGTSYLLVLGSLACLLAADTARNWLFLAGSYSAGATTTSAGSPSPC
ncbi:MAG: hypothetical protein H0V45_10690 [Actinobacteria bacterium]|nr:hypothetical protein [Actinomycetota bacterium]